MPTPAGFTAIIASRIQDVLGNLLAVGTLTIEPTDDKDRPLFAVAGGVGGPVVSGASANITNGMLAANTWVPDTALSKVPNQCYRFTFRDGAGNTLKVWTGVQFAPAPTPTATFNLDTYVPNLPGQATVVKGEKGDIGSLLPAQQALLSTNLAYLQNGGSVAALGTAGGTITSNSTVGVCLALPVPVATAGWLESIALTVSALPAGGTFRVLILSGTPPAPFTVVDSFVITPTATGLQTFIAGADYAPRQVAAGQFIGIYSADSTFGYQASGTAGYYAYAGAPPSSAVNWSGSASGRLDLAVNVRTLVPPAVSAATQAQIDGAIATGTTTQQQIAATRVSAPLLTNESFAGTSLPTGWTAQAGTWTCSNGLVSPTDVVGFNNVLQFARFFSLGERVLRVTFKMLASGSAIGVGSVTSPTDGNVAQPSLVIADAASGKLSIANSWLGGTPSIAANVTLPFSIATGVAYLLEVRVNEREITAQLFNPVSGQVATVSVGSNSASTGALTAWGNFADFPAIVAPAGQFKVLNFSQAAPRQSPEVMFIGDSITYGVTVPLVQRWASLVGAQLPGQSYMVSGRPGGIADGALGRVISEAVPMRPKTLVVMIGTNDLALGYGIAEVQTNLLAIIAQAQASGIRLALCALTQMSGSPSIVNTFNTWLLTLPATYPQVAIVRFDLATTLGNDGVTQNTAMFSSDQTHPNAAGCVAMAARFAVDVPWLFDATRPRQLRARALLATPQDGALEYDGTHLYFTIGGTRTQLI